MKVQLTKYINFEEFQNKTNELKIIKDEINRLGEVTKNYKKLQTCNFWLLHLTD